MERQAKRRIGIAALVIVGLLITLRLALPSIVRTYVNRVLDRHPDYEGHVGDIDIALFRGAYEIEGTVIEKTEGGERPLPFLDLERVDLSVEWRALLDGALVAEVVLLRPKVNFVGGSGAQNQAGTDVDWREIVNDLVPLKINRLAVEDGEVHYVDPTAKPKVDVFVDQLYVDAFNLTNSEDLSGTLVATVEARGRPMDLGDFQLKGSLDPYANTPTFDLDAAVRKVPLKRLNDFIQAYGRFDVEGGTMDMYTEVAAKEGKFSGYMKPLLTDVKVLDLPKETQRDKDNPLEVAWEAIVGAGKGVLENDQREQVATKVPIQGTFDDPEVDAWATVGSAIRNAFIEALMRGIEGTVDLKDVEAVSAQEAAEDDGKGGIFGKKNK